jgi:hypothetical protein
MESARFLPVAHPGLRRDLLTALLISGLAAAGVVVVTLLVRRTAGAFEHPLGGFSLLAVTGLGLLLATGWRMGWLARGNRQSTLSLMALAVPGFAAFLMLCVLSLPGTASWALMLTWLAFFTAEAVWWWLAYAALRPPITRRPIQPGMVTELVAGETEIAGASLPSEVFQQVTRTRERDKEQIAVSIRVAFAAGQRVAVEHVAFCPPLLKTPKLAAEVLDGPDATVSLTSIQPYGIRVEIRLEEPTDEACEVLVEVRGQCDAGDLAALNQSPSTEY